MRSMYFAYLLFAAALVLCYFLLPSFYLSNTVAVIISLAVISKYIKNSSLVYLVLIDIAVTVILPLIILYRVAHSLGTSLDIKTLTSFSNVFSFALPTLVLIAAVVSVKKIMGHKTGST